MEYSEKIKKLKKMFSEGSMTVEASYVVPLVIGIIFAVMTVSFYLYDINTVHSVLNKNIEEFVNLPVHPYEKDSSFFEYASVNERLLSIFSEDYENQENRGKEIIKKDGSDIENIPYKETNMYVRKIINNLTILNKYERSLLLQVN